jgi:isopenicillin N synthase-like dioxygenase
MNYADVKDIDVEEIPVIDIASLFGDSPDYKQVGEQLELAAKTVGFFYVSGHCIDEDTMQRAFSMSRRFFAADEDRKADVRAQGYHRGLLPFGASRMEGQSRDDLKESFIWGMDFAADNPQFLAGNEFMPPNRWPDFLPEMRGALLDYLDAAHHCGKALLRAVAAALEIEQDYFIGRFNNPISRGALIHYPPQPPTMGKDQFGVSPHTDYGTLTILAQDMSGGLRVKSRTGEWLTAHPIPGTLVVNIGDLLARWSNDRFLSNAHAVVNTSGRERYSIAIAMDPDWDTLISPVTKPGEEPLHGDVSCGEYIRGRFDRSFAYRAGDTES